MTTAETIALCAIVVSVGTFTVSALALRTTWKLWRLTNRPIIAVGVETVSAGNMGTGLKLVVSNAGNRPATDVRLTVDDDALGRLLMGGADDGPTKAIRRCFSSECTIPLLTPGRSAESSFGFLAVGQPSSTWREQMTLPVEVSFRDLETGRGYRYTVTIRIADNDSFTGSMWKVVKKTG